MMRCNFWCAVVILLLAGHLSGHWVEECKGADRSVPGPNYVCKKCERMLYDPVNRGPTRRRGALYL